MPGSPVAMRRGAPGTCPMRPRRSSSRSRPCALALVVRSSQFERPRDAEGRLQTTETATGRALDSDFIATLFPCNGLPGCTGEVGPITFPGTANYRYRVYEQVVRCATRSGIHDGPHFSPIAAMRPLVRRQQGIVVFVALIAVVLMSLAAVGLMRSVHTSTIVVGNLRFRRQRSRWPALQWRRRCTTCSSRGRWGCDQP